MLTEASTRSLSWIPKTREKSGDEKKKKKRQITAPISQEHRYVRNLEVWSRITNDPRRMNSRRCADSLGETFGPDTKAPDGRHLARTCETLWCHLVCLVYLYYPKQNPRYKYKTGNEKWRPQNVRGPFVLLLHLYNVHFNINDSISVDHCQINWSTVIHM